MKTPSPPPPNSECEKMCQLCPFILHNTVPTERFLNQAYYAKMYCAHFIEPFYDERSSFFSQTKRNCSFKRHIFIIIMN